MNPLMPLVITVTVEITVVVEILSDPITTTISPSTITTIITCLS